MFLYHYLIFLYNEKIHHFYIRYFPNDLATLCPFLLLMKGWPVTSSLLLEKYENRQRISQFMI